MIIEKIQLNNLYVITWWISIGSLNVQKLDILSPFSLPSKEKGEVEKENELAKPGLNKYFSDPLNFPPTLHYITRYYPKGYEM